MKTFRDLNRNIELGDLLCRRNAKGLTLLLVIEHEPRRTFGHNGMFRYQVLRHDSIPENVGNKHWGEIPLNERVYSPASELIETQKKDDNNT